MIKLSYIEAEQFLALDEKVQKVFIEWWDPEVGDLFEHKLLPSIKNIVVKKWNYLIKGFYNDNFENKKYHVPLFRLDQLWSFIEEKTKLKSGINIYNDTGYDIYFCCSNNSAKIKYIKKDLGTDKLQAFWKVAVEIAKEEIGND